jgi:hypothetical protein
MTVVPLDKAIHAKIRRELELPRQNTVSPISRCSASRAPGAMR